MQVDAAVSREIDLGGLTVREIVLAPPPILPAGCEASVVDLLGHDERSRCAGRCDGLDAWRRLRRLLSPALRLQGEVGEHAVDGHHRRRDLPGGALLHDPTARAFAPRMTRVTRSTKRSRPASSSMKRRAARPMRATSAGAANKRVIASRSAPGLLGGTYTPVSPSTMVSVCPRVRVAITHLPIA